MIKTLRRVAQPSATVQHWQAIDESDAAGDVAEVGRASQPIAFRTELRDGLAGVVFQWVSQVDAPLNRWPGAGVAVGQDLDLVPSRHPAELASFVLRMQSLSALDWERLQMIVLLLARAHEAGRSPQDKAWLAGWVRFGHLMQQLPAPIRFDRIALVSAHAEPDYAHLGVRLEGLVLKNRRYPDLSFRLATVPSPEGEFDANPRLEFPASVPPALERWFVESTNRFGDKFELRFAKKDSLMDMPVFFLRLNDHDRYFLAALVETLPVILAELRAGGASPAHGWDAWQRVTQTIQQVFQLQASPRL